MASFYVWLLLDRPYPYTGVGSMGKKPYVLWAFVLVATVGQQGVRMMILLESFLRADIARERVASIHRDA